MPSLAQFITWIVMGLLGGSLDQISISLRDVVAAFVGSLIVLAAIGLWQSFQKSQ